MKKISLCTFFVFIFVIYIFPLNSVYASSVSKTEYDIQIESLKNSEDVNELKFYKKELVKYLNNNIKRHRKAAGNDAYSYFTYNDLDFYDETKMYGLKYHGTYTEYEPNATYNSFVKLLGDEYQWRITAKKNGTIIDFVLYKTDNKKTYGNKIGGDWYAVSCYVEDIELPYDSPQVIENNMQRMLNDNKETSKDIKLFFVGLDRTNYAEGAVVFVDGIAKYIYAYGMDFPRAKLMADTPTAVKCVIEETASAIGNNSDNRDTKTKRLYSYNMIMAFYSLCEYYSK